MYRTIPPSFKVAVKSFRPDIFFDYLAEGFSNESVYQMQSPLLIKIYIKYLSILYFPITCKNVKIKYKILRKCKKCPIESPFIIKYCIQKKNLFFTLFILFQLPVCEYKFITEIKKCTYINAGV